MKRKEFSPKVHVLKVINANCQALPIHESTKIKEDCTKRKYFVQFSGSKNNQTSWLEENTAKLYFSSSIFDKLIPNTFLHRAVLRYD